MVRKTLLLSLLALLLLSSASAHTTQTTDDGKYRLTTGNLGEPVYTWVKTGLDLIVRNADDSPVENVHLSDLEVTLIAPSGAELSAPLRAQHGQPGRYSFDEGYTLTEPGNYTVRFSGDLFGTPVTHTQIVGSGPVHDQAGIYFPDTDIPDLAGLRDQIAAIEARLAAVETEQEEAPGPGVILVLGALLMVAAGLRKRLGD